MQGHLPLAMLSIANNNVPAACRPRQTICLIMIIGYVCLAAFFIITESVFYAYLSVLSRRHNSIAKKWGYSVKVQAHVPFVYTLVPVQVSMGRKF